MAYTAILTVTLGALQFTPLEQAILENNVNETRRLASSLVQGHQALDDHPRAFELAATRKSAEQLLQILLATGAAPGRAANRQPGFVWQLINHATVPSLRILFKNGVDPDPSGKHHFGERTPLFKCIEMNWPDKVAVLLESKVNPRLACAYRGSTDVARFGNRMGGEVLPLNMAAYLGNTGIVKLLHKHGAKINDTNFKGESALHAAVLGYQGKNFKPYPKDLEQRLRSTPESIAALRRLKVDPKLKTVFGETAYDIAKRKGYSELLPLLKSTR